VLQLLIRLTNGIFEVFGKIPNTKHQNNSGDKNYIKTNIPFKAIRFGLKIKPRRFPCLFTFRDATKINIDDAVGRKSSKVK